MWFVLCLLSFAFATESFVFTDNTASTLKKGDWAVGVFGPLRYGLKEDIELSLHPGWAILAPHVSIKKSYGEKGTWMIASQHRLGYPSPMLRFLARPGIGGILAADSTIPHIINSDNQVFLSKTVQESILTFSGGVSVAISFGESDYRTIDLPYGYRKTALYQNYVALQAGMGWEKMFTEWFGYRYSMNIWSIPLADDKWSLEQGNSILLQMGKKTQMNLGAAVVVGEYPYGINWHVLPTFDVVFSW